MVCYTYSQIMDHDAVNYVKVTSFSPHLRIGNLIKALTRAPRLCNVVSIVSMSVNERFSLVKPVEMEA